MNGKIIKVGYVAKTLLAKAYPSVKFDRRKIKLFLIRQQMGFVNRVCESDFLVWGHETRGPMPKEDKKGNPVLDDEGKPIMVPNYHYVGVAVPSGIPRSSWNYFIVGGAYFHFSATDVVEEFKIGDEIKLNEVIDWDEFLSTAVIEEKTFILAEIEGNKTLVEKMVKKPLRLAKK